MITRFPYYRHRAGEKADPYVGLIARAGAINLAGRAILFAAGCVQRAPHFSFNTEEGKETRGDVHRVVESITRDGQASAPRPVSSIHQPRSKVFHGGRSPRKHRWISPDTRVTWSDDAAEPASRRFPERTLPSITRPTDLGD